VKCDLHLGKGRSGGVFLLAFVLAILGGALLVNRIIGPAHNPNAWGGRSYLSNNDNDKFPRSATLVFTPTFEVPRLFFVQMLFANDLSLITGAPSGQNAVLPFSSVVPNVGTAIGGFQVRVQRSMSDKGSTTEDVYNLSGSGDLPEEPTWLPISIVSAKKLVIVVKNIGDVSQWVDVSVTPIETLTQDQMIALRWSTAAATSTSIDNSLPNIFGFGEVAGTIGNGPTRVPASATPVELLPADQTRRQFWISNESTDRLALRFSATQAPDVTPGSESWDVILGAKGSATAAYQSPLDAYWGRIQGVWEGTNGFALANSAIYLIR
jgi:hypothetical protein